jgi:catechol 2,3-dioxygenase-like lactoylglutathione lyase family enzyme
MTRLVRVALRATDLDRAAAFYGELLGAEPTGPFEPPGLLFFDLLGLVGFEPTARAGPRRLSRQREMDPEMRCEIHREFLCESGAGVGLKAGGRRGPELRCPPTTVGLSDQRSDPRITA